MATKIGVFDSGVGGLSILTPLLTQQFDCNFVYLADAAKNGYGSRPKEEITELTFNAISTLLEDFSCDIVVLACNTASTVLPLIEHLFYPRTIVGIINPTIEAIKHLNITNLGVLATPHTVSTRIYEESLQIPVYQHACPTWASMIETENISETTIKTDIELLLNKAPLTHITLCCTHYPLLINSIQKFVPSHIEILTQGEFVATALKKHLNQAPVLAAAAMNKCQFYTTGSTEIFNRIASQLLQKQINSRHIKTQNLALK